MHISLCDTNVGRNDCKTINRSHTRALNDSGTHGFMVIRCAHCNELVSRCTSTRSEYAFFVVVFSLPRIPRKRFRRAHRRRRGIETICRFRSLVTNAVAHSSRSAIGTTSVNVSGATPRKPWSGGGGAVALCWINIFRGVRIAGAALGEI